MEHPDLTPAFGSYRKNPPVWTHCLGNKWWKFRRKSHSIHGLDSSSFYIILHHSTIYSPCSMAIWWDTPFQIQINSLKQPLGHTQRPMRCICLHGCNPHQRSTPQVVDRVLRTVAFHSRPRHSRAADQQNRTTRNYQSTNLSAGNWSTKHAICKVP